MQNTNSRMFVGNTSTINMVVCDSGTIKMVKIEGYDDGFVWFVKLDDGYYTDHSKHETAQKAINAAAKNY